MARAFALGGDMTVCRTGLGAMRITGQGAWSPPRDRGEALERAGAGAES